MTKRALKWNGKAYEPYDLPDEAVFIPMIWTRKLPAANAEEK